MIGLESGFGGDRHDLTPFLSDSTRSVSDKISQLLQQSNDQPLTLDKTTIEMRN